jgi:hypothetical protein
MIRPWTARSALLIAVVAPATGTAQQLAYQATADTLQYLSANTYLLYFVQGTDTLGSPVTTHTLEFRKATAASDNLAIWVRLKGVGESPFQVEETYTVDPTGRLLAVGGKPLAEVPSARVDLLPRFPSSSHRLARGLKWSDSVASRGDQPYGRTSYEARREYQVLRIIDTLGTTVAHIAGSGRMRLRQGGWQDEAQKFAWWQEVDGPVVDTVYFDTRRGLILASFASIDLVGSGGAVGGPVLPSGLRSTVRLGPK